MMIAWTYLDKQTATIAALRDYNSMKFICDNTSDEKKEIRERMTALRSSNLNGMPSARDPKAGEGKLAEQLDTIDVLEKRYDCAEEYMAWFKAAWDALSDTEQLILREFYMGESQKSGATYRLMDRLGYSERQIERLKNKAITQLAVLLYGK